MSQTGAVGLGSIPSVQPQPESRPITFGSWAMIVIGTSWPGPLDHSRGLVVPQHDEHGVLVAVALDERVEGAQRVLDRLRVSLLGVGRGRPGRSAAD